MPFVSTDKFFRCRKYLFGNISQKFFALMKNVSPRLVITNVANVLCQNRVKNIFFFRLRFSEVGEILTSVRGHKNCIIILL